MNIFCGSLNCYDILGVNKDASIKDIKKVHHISVIVNKTNFFHQLILGIPSVVIINAPG